MIIRQAKLEEINEILEVFEAAKKIMRENGNFAQWNDGYPSRELLTEDIGQGYLFVVEIEEKIEAVFALIEGEDPTYIKIDGDWINDYPYATIHRVASRGRKKGILSKIFEYSNEVYSNLKIDTHEDNLIMQHLVKKFGFIYCGIIYVADGSPRLAYQKYNK